MKTHSDEYIAEETKKKRKPTELFHLWREGGIHWRYTSADFTITYDSNDFTPVTVSRGPARYDTEFEVSTMRVTFGYVDDPVIEYIAQNPVELIWLQVLRWYEAVPDEPSVVFVGQIKNVSFEGNEANVTCVGFEHYLQQRVPKFRYQIGCNNDLFDSFCEVVKASWVTNTTVTAVDGLVLTSADFGLQEDGYFTRGFVKWGDYYRMIVHHVGNDITIRFRMPDFASGQVVDAYSGCDRQLTTCVDKFSNGDNFFGHPWIPLDNPSKWIP
jgi:uncharacterized phage protein (TIGR02218 family)